ncbi:MAG: zinc ABC transporter substrate-binding protein [Pyramidobacter sp.]|nr:zinc ABC transporter substrate-binding protein [Pyramidobacter sp.]
MKLKTVLAVCAAIVLAVPAAAAKPRVVTTLFPIYDWTRNIIGERKDAVELLPPLNTGVDLHSYQPSVDDILRISTSDLFIYIGGLSDAWVERVLRDAVNKKLASVSLIKALGGRAREEETVEGMEAGHHHHGHDEHEKDHDHHEHEKDHGHHEHEKDHDHHEHDEGPEYDEHVWLSLVNARLLCGRIAQALSEVDPQGADAYRANAAAYSAKLDALDAKYRAGVASAKHTTLLFADRFPFRYLVDDYGLSYFAAFQGCSAESEASFKTILFLADKLDALGLPCVLTIEGSSKKIAETVVRTAKRGPVPILTLDSMQSVRADGIASSPDYLAVMERNLAILQEALK